MRKIKFANGEYYHIYNRGVDKRDVFMDENDFKRFLKSLQKMRYIGNTPKMKKYGRIRD